MGHTWRQKAPAAATDNLSFASHIGEFGGLQSSSFSQVNRNLAQTSCCMDFGLEGKNAETCHYQTEILSRKEIPSVIDNIDKHILLST